MATFLNGAVAMACLAISAYFIRFWRESGDRLFTCLAGAFGIFAINYAALGLLPMADERRAYAYVLRLVGFVTILIGVMIKNAELAEHMSSDNRQ